MIAVSSAIAAALTQAVTEPVMLVEVDGIDGLHCYAEEPLRWSGRNYAGRLLEPIALAVTAAGLDNGVRQRVTASIQLADGDGALRRKPPFAWRNRTVRVREVFRDVDSDAVRTINLVITACRGTPTTWTLECVDVLGAFGQLPVPALEATITPAHFPNLNQVGVSEFTAPLLYGRQYVPLTRVAQTSLDDVFIACVGCATLSGVVCTLETSGLSQLTYPLSTARYPGTAPYTVEYVRQQGVPLTQIRVQAGAPTDRVLLYGAPLYADLTGPLGADVTPVQVLADLVCSNAYGARLTTVFESSAYAAAHSACVAASHYCDAIVTPSRPLEQIIEQLLHDGMLRLLPGDPLRLSYLGSAALVGSFGPNNIVAETFEVEDVSPDQERSDRTIAYADRTTAVLSGFAMTSVRWAASSATAMTATAPFIGRGVVAAYLAHTYAEVEAAGVRRYRFVTGAQAGALEPGDPVSLTHTPAGVAGLRCEVYDVQRVWPETHITLRPQPLAAFAGAWVPEDPGFSLRFQRIGVVGSYGYMAVEPAAAIVFAGSHQLGGTPRDARVVAAWPHNQPLLVSSIITLTGSTYSLGACLISLLPSSLSWTVTEWIKAVDLWS